MSIFIKDLDEPYKEMALIEQERAGHPRQSNMNLCSSLNKGNFLWRKAGAPGHFWSQVNKGESPTITPEIEAKYPTIFGGKLKVSGLSWRDMEKGGIYKVTCNNRSNIFEVTGKPSEHNIPSKRYLSITGSRYTSNGNYWTGTTFTYSRASIEEANWFKACRRADKFVSREDARPSRVPDAFIAGQYYVGLRSNYLIKAQYTGSKPGWSTGISMEGNSFDKENYNISPGKSRKATGDERLWLDACIAADKFISKEEALSPARPKPSQEITRFISGNFYYMENNVGGFSIIRANESGTLVASSVLIARTKHFWMDSAESCRIGSYRSLRSADISERLWLERCIEANRYLDRDEIALETTLTPVQKLGIADMHITTAAESQRAVTSAFGIGIGKTGLHKLETGKYVPYTKKKSKKKRPELTFKAL